MLTPSQEQLLGQLRLLLPSIGMMLTTLGVVKKETWGPWETMILLGFGPAMIVGASVWSFITNTRTALVKKVDVIAKEPDSPVKAIITTNTQEGFKLAESLPGKTTVPAGTIDAAALARP